MLNGSENRVVAFQRRQLMEIRDLFGELDLDLQRLLDQETQTADDISELQRKVAEAKAKLLEIGADPALLERRVKAVPGEDEPTEARYERLEVIRAVQYEELSRKADEYLRRRGIDLEKDPLPQILTAGEMHDLAEQYRRKHGDISWSEADYAVVMVAGVAATLVDIFLAGLPVNPDGKNPVHFVSPITKRVRKYTDDLYEKHRKFFKKLERMAKVPYDGSTSDDVDGQVEGIRPKLHRLMSFGHDPGLLIVGVLDIMSGKGTYVDKFGKVKKVVADGYDQVGFIEAFNRAFLHLLSDVFTKMGIPPPFFSLMQLMPGKSPFWLSRKTKVRVSWTDLARYMYANGYDFRHYIAMGVVPATVQCIINAYWLYCGFEDKEKAEKERLKLASMLLLGHMLALAGNVVKIGIVGAMVGPEYAPLAINWAQLKKMKPVTISFFSESVKRDRRLRSELDAEWLSIYRDVHPM